MPTNPNIFCCRTSALRGTALCTLVATAACLAVTAHVIGAEPYRLAFEDPLPSWSWHCEPADLMALSFDV